MIDEKDLLKTTKVEANEIVKANDFMFGFESIIENVAMATKALVNAEKNFVISDKRIDLVEGYTGLNIKVNPFYGVNAENGTMFMSAGVSDPIALEAVTQNSVQILQVKSEFIDYNEEQRAFNDLNTGNITYRQTNTKTKYVPQFVVKSLLGNVAPETDEGYVKLAEIIVPANAESWEECTILNITADIPTDSNVGWTTQADSVYNLGYLSQVREEFRNTHNEDGSHKANVIDITMLKTSGEKGITGNNLPSGKALTVAETSLPSTNSISSVMESIVTVINNLYASYLKNGKFTFNEEVKISSEDDEEFANAFSISADGEGNATLKIGDTVILTFSETEIKVGDNYSINTTTSNDAKKLVTAAVTNAIWSSIADIRETISQIVQSADQTVFSNGVLSRFFPTTDGVEFNAATTTSVTFSGETATRVVDGISLQPGYLVLVKNQDDSKQNGIYTISSDGTNITWSRYLLKDYDKTVTYKHKIWTVKEGTVNKGKMFYCPLEVYTSESIGTDYLPFYEFMGSIRNVPGKAVMRSPDGTINFGTGVGNTNGSHNGTSNGTHSGTFNGTFNGIAKIKNPELSEVAAELDGSTFNGESIKNTVAIPTGNEAGNIPKIGTEALGLDANYPILTDGNGNLKKGTGPMKAAAYKDVNDTVSLTSTNVPSTKAVTSMIYTAIYSGGGNLSTSGTLNLDTISIPGVQIGSDNKVATGTVVRILFSQMIRTSGVISNVTLKIQNSSGVVSTVAGIVSPKSAASADNQQPNANYTYLKSHAVSSTATFHYNATYPNILLDAGTVLELVFDGTYWVVMQNTDVVKYSDATVSYTIKADGLIEQCYYNNSSLSQDASTYFNFPIPFSNNGYVCFSQGIFETSNYGYDNLLAKTVNSFAVRTSSRSRPKGATFYAKGY